MIGSAWKDSEKKIARRLFDIAVQQELREIIAEFKARAAAANEPDEMWAIQEHLTRARREFDQKYDYRYSQLEFVFGRLLREGRIKESDLNGLSEDKVACIRRLASP